MLSEGLSSQLAVQYQQLRRIYDVQPSPIQRFLEKQVGMVVSALGQNRRVSHFRLPEQIILEDGTQRVLAPAASRLSLNGHARKPEQIFRSLKNLEQDPNPALAMYSRLFRFALARHILYDVIPDGKWVEYLPEADGDIPSIPVGEARQATILAPGDSGFETDLESSQLHVPFVAAALNFYLPQFVVFGEADCLLVGSLKEAEASIASLSQVVNLLRKAVELCPSLAVDETYQRKRLGLTGQLVNQGRALARAYTRGVIQKIHTRAEAGSLNRGLSLSLPYFDDENMRMSIYPVEVIPGGRISFVPAFIVLRMQQTERRVMDDLHISPTTRKHLLEQLFAIETAFDRYSPAQS